MPLPGNQTPWPPPQLQGIAQPMREWSAWYSGAPDALEAAYIRGAAQSVDKASQYRGGVGGAISRFWWGQPRGDLTQPRAKLHVPVAAEICQASADLLFADHPEITVDHPATQDLLDTILDDGAYTVFGEAAEVGAALGGSYVRVTWDREVSPEGPFLTVMHADAAVPEFRFGRLRAVTFWRVIAQQNNAVLRHLERHELNAAANGVILHGLFEGTEQNLGRKIPLTDNSQTAGLALEVGEDGVTIDTETPGLAVVYVPNARPQRRWRTHTVGYALGRSDLDGVESMMDALDETYSSWMRDIRLGKSRVFIARSMLENNGPGRGASFDADQEVYAPLNMLVDRKDGGMPLEAHQFTIRYAEHSATAKALVEEILGSAGYSTQTFGVDTEGRMAPKTATEIEARDQRSLLTRDRKVRLWRPALIEIVEKLLAVAVVIFGTRDLEPSAPTVVFPEGVQDSMTDLAATAAALRTANAASTRTLVALVHPDWDDQAIDDEVAAIGGQATPSPVVKLAVGAARPDGTLVAEGDADAA